MSFGAGIQRSMILWTAILVVLLGGISFTLLLEPPSTLAQSMAAVAHAKANAKPSVLSSDGRTPASEEPLAGGKAVQYRSVALDEQDSRRAIELKLPCPTAGKENKNLFATNITQVRITGEACGAAREIASTEVVNDSNGFSATVFFPTTRQFTTDYITLKAGPNRIKIAHLMKNGTREAREYLIERQPAEAAPKE